MRHISHTWFWSERKKRAKARAKNRRKLKAARRRKDLQDCRPHYEKPEYFNHVAYFRLLTNKPPTSHDLITSTPYKAQLKP